MVGLSQCEISPGDSGYEQLTTMNLLLNPVVNRLWLAALWPQPVSQSYVRFQLEHSDGKEDIFSLDGLRWLIDTQCGLTAEMVASLIGSGCRQVAKNLGSRFGLAQSPVYHLSPHCRRRSSPFPLLSRGSQDRRACRFCGKGVAAKRQFPDVSVFWEYDMLFISFDYVSHSGEKNSHAWVWVKSGPDQINLIHSSWAEYAAEMRTFSVARVARMWDAIQNKLYKECQVDAVVGFKLRPDWEQNLREHTLPRLVQDATKTLENNPYLYWMVGPSPRVAREEIKQFSRTL